MRRASKRHPKVAILAGGLGTRLSELTRLRPKALVEVGGRPILWHVMKQFDYRGFRDFVVALGHGAEQVKRYVMDLRWMHGDLAVQVRQGRVRLLAAEAPDWTVRLVDTGPQTPTGGRLLQLWPHLGSSGSFFLTYCDVVSDVDLRELLAFHRSHGKLVTVMAVRPAPRFGHLTLDGSRVCAFREKPDDAEGWVNGGVFVLEPPALEYVADASVEWEREPLERLAAKGQLMAYRHSGFWRSMDTLRDHGVLEDLWRSGRPPWRLWE